MPWLVALLFLLPTPAIAEIAGPASVIGGDTIEIAGRRLRAATRVAAEGKRPAGEPVPRPMDCPIKGDIEADGARVYHLPGGRSYDRTSIDPARGERWFCTEEEARAAGWRPPDQ